MAKQQSIAQVSRQQSRESGRYAKHNPCYLCDKSAGVNYCSHPLTDGLGSDGVPFGDTALQLCMRCESATRSMTTVSQILEYANKFKKVWP